MLNFQGKDLLEKLRIMNKRELGTQGEECAIRYLKSKKYKIICKNFYTRMGEIDVVAKKENYIIFIEVKTRTNFKYGTPASAVDSNKIRHMKSAAKVFLMFNRFNKYSIRFDVIEVFFQNGNYKINHIKQII